MYVYIYIKYRNFTTSCFACVQVFASLTGSFAGNYGPPDGFDWDVQLNDEPVEDNSSLETYNLPERVEAFVQAAKKQVRQHIKENVATFVHHRNKDTPL